MTPKRSAQGRSLAFLVAWARAGQEECVPDGEDGQKVHFAGRLCRGHWAFLADGAGQARVQARDWVEQAASMAAVRTHERQPRDGEPLEPPGAP